MKINNSEMEMSDLGVIVREELLRSFEIRRELKCISYVIMPNHLHLLVELIQSVQDKNHRLTTSGLQPKSISTFVGGFKSSVTTRINTIRSSAGKKVWHPRFYDHLIKNNCEYEFIYNYIASNPATWEKDRFNGKKNPYDKSADSPEN